jgi:hypothetical protein
LNSAASRGISPTNVLKLVADDAAGSTFDAAFVREEHTAVLLRCIASCRTAINALLSLALETEIAVDYPDMSAIGINIIRIDAQFQFEPDAVSYSVHNCQLTVSVADASK